MRPTSRSHRSDPLRSALACTGWVLIVFALGCGEGDGRVEAAAVALEFIELESFNECDSAENPGDFYIDARLADVTDRGSRRFGTVYEHRVNAHAETVAVDLGIEGELRQEQGRVVELRVEYDEHDGGDNYDGRGIATRRFAWSSDDRCWALEGSPDVCVEPGSEQIFALDLSGGTCRARLLYSFAADTVRRTPNEVHGPYMGAGELSVTITAVDSGEDWVCEGGHLGMAYDPEADRPYEGGGECRSTFNRSGMLEYTAEAAFVSDTEVRGTLHFEGSGQIWTVPFEGTRELRTIPVTISEVVADPSGGSDLHWMGSFDLRL